MENMTTTGKVLTTLDSFGGYGYGRGDGTHIGNGLIALQNAKINDNVKDNGCAIAKSELGLTATIGQSASFAEMRDQNRFITLDNKIDKQTAAFSSELSTIKQDLCNSRLDIRDMEIRRLDKEAILEGQKSNSLEAQLNAYRFPQPATATNPCPIQTTTCNGGGLDMNAINIAIGNGIAQGIAQIAPLIKQS